MNVMTGGHTTLYLTQLNGRTLFLKAAHYSLDIGPVPGMGTEQLGHFRLTAEGFEADVSNDPETNARSLARAVLGGDIRTALLLADEVQLNYLLPADESFVPRQDLVSRIRELEAREAELEREIRLIRSRHSKKEEIW